jgi:hypothetical protein
MLFTLKTYLGYIPDGPALSTVLGKEPECAEPPR